MVDKLISICSEEKKIYSVSSMKNINFDDEKSKLLIIENNKNPVGVVALKEMDFENANCKLNISLFNNEILNEFGDKILKIIREYCFRQIPFHRIYGFVPEKDHELVLLLEMVGFKMEGRLSDYQYEKGEYQSYVVYGILKREYEVSGDVING
jgi:RimJ/RimL family protein N-acetyltransferase